MRVTQDFNCCQILLRKMPFTKQKMYNDSTTFDIDDFEMQLELQWDINRDKLNKEKLCMIHPDVIVQYNSLNVAVSCQGGGKTNYSM